MDTCQRRFCGRREPCGGLLNASTDGNGRVVVWCKRCDRYDARRCIDCGLPVKGRRLRCDTHQRIQQKRDQIKYSRNHRAVRKMWARTHKRSRLEANQRWREKNPLKVATYRRRERLKLERRKAA